MRFLILLIFALPTIVFGDTTAKSLPALLNSQLATSDLFTVFDLSAGVNKRMSVFELDKRWASGGGGSITGNSCSSGQYAKGIGTDGTLSCQAVTSGQVTGGAPTASPTFTGTVTLPSGSVTSSAWSTGTSGLTVNGVAFSAKAPAASPTFSGTVTLPSGTVTSSAWDTGTSSLTVNGVAFTDKLSSTGFIEEWTGFIETASERTFYVVPYSQMGRKVVSARIACIDGGTITVALKIGGTNITTCNGISVTSSPATTTCDTGSTSTLAANGILTLVTSSNSSCLGLYWDIKTTRQ